MAIGLFVASLLFKASRATFDEFIAEPLYFYFWGTLLITHIIAKLYSKRVAMMAANKSIIQ